MGMENNDLLREQAKKLRQIADQLYTIKEETILSKEELIDVNVELDNITSELNGVNTELNTITSQLTSVNSELDTITTQVTQINTKSTDIDSATSFSAGYTGSRLVTSTSGTVTGQFRGFVVNEDVIVATCLDKDGVSLMGTSAMNLTGNQINQGVYMSVGETNWISSIMLTSGSIALYNK